MEKTILKGYLDNSYVETLTKEEKRLIVTLLLSIQTKLINHSFDFDEEEREMMMKMVVLKLVDIY